ncbi:hypothetical protein C2E25_12080 [Geothermobacter hydrogeniphilus]|uniref:Uncharacterized protein n=1 Tax=Geothermobacter hydrogeniphilus TaxID=1969733 RepID=A0A2K2H836_9BACT|nr:hypothetical protein [Geothermobacter hydrogeniphilus]PNU19474.1 hypothetical protein C2E25_12080 [Geothermobacter hydrogeniphilus]
MGPDPILSLRNEDEHLALGSRVIACWSDNLGSFRARGVVASLHPNRVRVRLLESAGRFPAGSSIDLPRIMDSQNWSSEHCVYLETSKVSGF